MLLHWDEYELECKYIWDDAIALRWIEIRMH